MSVFEKLRRTPVRKNITMDASVADSLERLSGLSGVPQGDIIAKALGAWRMRMLMALATGQNPVADALDIYLASYQRVPEDVVIAFCTMFGNIVASTRFKGAAITMTCAGRDGVVTDVSSCREAANAYVAGHLKSAGFGNVRDLAVVNEFVVEDGERTKANVMLLLNSLRCVAALDGSVDEYAMRVLVVLFRDFAYPIEDADRATQYGVFVAQREVFGI